MSVGGTLGVIGATSLTTGSISGIVTAPTATAGTNTQQLATTAFVGTAVTAATGALGTMSTQNANNVAITGGTIIGITDLAVADGGTGASSITANSVVLGNGTSALSGNLVAPSTAGKVLVSNGTTWTAQTIAASGIKLGLGITGEVWTDVTGSRVSGTTYTNSLGYPIMVCVGNAVTNVSHLLYCYVAGVLVINPGGSGNNYNQSQNATFIVPTGATYSVTTTGVPITLWTELY
jgi:hypothetical protein